ncbi:MAG: fused MFS/spermidine synthase, partial [bacterium]|nr:fused MFS/spermidine synthase [bacterium]
VPEGYFSAIAVLPAVFADDSRRIRILILGNAGGTIGNLIQRFFPDRNLDITGVELDPAVTALTSRWFSPPPRPYPIIHADSRAFVRESDEQYDIIVVDAYTNQLTIPPHLASVEFFRLLRSRLSPDGFVVANVNAPHRNSRLLHTFEQTIAAAFPSVIVGSPGAWNYLLIAGEHAMLPAVRTAIGDRATFTDVMAEAGASGKRVFTDDWAPIEMFTDLELFDAIRTRM